MKKYIDLSGCGTALITPFKDGAVDYDAFAALIKNLRKVSAENEIDIVFTVSEDEANLPAALFDNAQKI